MGQTVRRHELHRSLYRRDKAIRLLNAHNSESRTWLDDCRPGGWWTCRRFALHWDSDTSNIQHVRVPSILNPTVTIPWNTAFPDTAYTSICTPENAGQNEHTHILASVTPGSINITNDVSPPGIWHCIAVPDSDSSNVRHVRPPIPPRAKRTALTARAQCLLRFCSRATMYYGMIQSRDRWQQRYEWRRS